MGSIKNFLFPSHENDELDSTTVVLGNNLNKNQEQNKTNNSKTAIINPTTFSQVEDIANDILAGKSVIVDLTSASKDEAKRICDFLNGVIFAIDGKVDKINRLVYLFSPR